MMLRPGESDSKTLGSMERRAEQRASDVLQGIVSSAKVQVVAHIM
jgi:hypothetical protein